MYNGVVLVRLIIMFVDWCRLWCGLLLPVVCMYVCGWDGVYVIVYSNVKCILNLFVME